jgi:hypothetical protein
MPNGGDKNWVRLCAAVDGFRARHRSWPSRIRVFPEAIADLRDNVFDRLSLQRLEAKVSLVPDETPFIAEDDEGRSYNLGKEGFSKVKPDIRTSDWIGIVPKPEARWD